MMPQLNRFPLLLVLAWSCTPSALLALEVGGFEPDETVVYKETKKPALKMHVFLPPDFKKTDSRPAIVFFFGGGWSGGSASQFYPHCEYLASRGMVAMSADYRVAKTHKTSPKECVQDGKSAIRWLRTNAAQWGVDPDRIAAGGGSAGGHVAAATGTVKAFEEPGESTDISSKPNALVLFNPVYDNGPDGYGNSRVKAYWKEFSPMHNIDKTTPPAIVFLGDKDSLIPVATAEKFKSLMEKAGVKSELHIYEGQPHGFFNYRGDKANYRQTVTAADKFLAKLGYLKGEPTVDKQLAAESPK